MLLNCLFIFQLFSCYANILISKEGLLLPCRNVPTLFAYISCDDHTAKLVNDENIHLRRRLAELLLKDLQDMLHHIGSVSQSHSYVAQRSDGVIWN